MTTYPYPTDSNYSYQFLEEDDDGEEEPIQLTMEEVEKGLHKYDFSPIGHWSIDFEDIPKFTEELNKILREKQA